MKNIVLAKTVVPYMFLADIDENDKKSLLNLMNDPGGCFTDESDESSDGEVYYADDYAIKYFEDNGISPKFISEIPCDEIFASAERLSDAEDFVTLLDLINVRNARFKKLLELDAPQVIIGNERILLRKAIERLISNIDSSDPVMRGMTPCKSLSDFGKTLKTPGVVKEF